MRILAVLISIGLTACSGGEADSPPRLPGPLHRLVLNEHNEEMTSVSYGHLFHLDETAMGKAMACTDCHHHLKDDPGGIPVACATCHPHEKGDPRSRAVEAVTDGKAPDL